MKQLRASRTRILLNKFLVAAVSLLIAGSASGVRAAEDVTRAEPIPEQTLFSPLSDNQQITPPLSGDYSTEKLDATTANPESAGSLSEKNPSLNDLTLPVSQNIQEKTSPKAVMTTEKIPTQLNGIRHTLHLSALATKNPGELSPKSFSYESLFDGSAKNSGSIRIRPTNKDRKSTPFIVNDEGIQVSGMAAQYYQAVRRLVQKYTGKIDLSESLGVMDDTYADVWAKIKVIESVIQNHTLTHHNEHINETLTWLDGIIQIGPKKIAVSTYRVFFHHAPNRESEIKEGIRRADAYIKETQRLFMKHGRAEQAHGPLDQVFLGFDTRGYAEIKSFIQSREKVLERVYGDRFQFVYLDDVAQTPKTLPEMRTALNDLILKYKDDSLQKIVNGVIYSRYTGLLLELKTLEHYYNRNYTILQSGRELFDAEGHYVTELDAVVKSPEGTTYLVEAKSSRVLLPPTHVLEEKILYKLNSYRKNRALLEKEIGAPLNIVFSMDLGIPKDQRSGRGAERAHRQKKLMEFLNRQAPVLSHRYGFPVSFLFIDGGASRN